MVRHLGALREHGGTTVVLCTHQPHGLARWCDQVVLLDRGRAIASGTVDDLLARHWPRREHVIRVDDPQVAAQITAGLRARRVTVHGPEPVVPSLHDLYFRLLEEGRR